MKKNYLIFLWSALCYGQHTDLALEEPKWEESLKELKKSIPILSLEKIHELRAEKKFRPTPPVWGKDTKTKGASRGLVRDFLKEKRLKRQGQTYPEGGQGIFLAFIEEGRERSFSLEDHHEEKGCPADKLSKFFSTDFFSKIRELPEEELVRLFREASMAYQNWTYVKPSPKQDAIEEESLEKKSASLKEDFHAQLYNFENYYKCLSLLTILGDLEGKKSMMGVHNKILSENPFSLGSGVESQKNQGEEGTFYHKCNVYIKTGKSQVEKSLD